MRLWLVIVIGIVSSVRASTYYVSTSGDNGNPGTSGQPWRNLWYAAHNSSGVAPGDAVIVKAGTFNEFVTNLVSGTSGNEITFTGERGSDGSWLTILDPSTDLSTGWTAAPEIGSGVFKNTTSFRVHELTINNKRVAFVYTNGPAASIAVAYPASGLTDGYQLLALSSAATLTTLNGNSVTFWDTAGALWGTTNSTTLYLRIRDGSDPNGLSIRVAPNGTSLPQSTVVNPAIDLSGSSYVIYKNLLIRNAFAGIEVGPSAHHNTIISNCITGGYCRVDLGGGGTNTIQGNSLLQDYYGYSDIGAWTGGTTSTYYNRENIYCISKFLMGGYAQGSLDDAVHVRSGDSNVITQNLISNGLGTGVNVNGDTKITGTVVSSNRISSLPSVGVHLSYNQTHTYVFGNSISDCNISFRFHALNRSGETDRTNYVYRNTSWMPQAVGEHTFFSFYGGDACTYFPDIWIYHNSFSGGYDAFAVGIALADYAIQNISRVFLVNNVLSGYDHWIADVSAGFCTNASMVGYFDYNERTLPLGAYAQCDTPAWSGANNANSATAEWGLGSIPPRWQLKANSVGLNTALDLTQSFILNGVTYGALPSNGTAKFGTAWDMGAVEGQTGAAISNAKLAGASL